MWHTQPEVRPLPLVMIKSNNIVFVIYGSNAGCQYKYYFYKMACLLITCRCLCCSYSNLDSRVLPLWTGDVGRFALCTTPTTRAVMARKPRWQGTAFSWRWVSLWVYYNFVIKISRKKHTQPPSSLPSGRVESLSGEKNLSETEQGQWEKYMSGRGRRRRRRRRGGAN